MKKQINKLNHNYLMKPFPRLHFPIKEQQEGYVGRRHYNQQYRDQIQLTSSKSSKILRHDKMDIHDIEGTRPNLNIECINNTVKGGRSSRSLKTIPSVPTDSLEKLVRENQPINKKLKTLGNQEELRMKKFTLEKKNLFGVYDYNPEMYTAKNEPKSGNPTFLSSLKGI